MNLIQGKSNQFLREAILEGSLEKARRYLTLKIGKADVGALTESGGFNMLHVAAIMGNTQIVVMLLQYGADVHALTDDGYTALDLAIWRGHLQIIELLRSQGSIAPMKEPESLNGRVIVHLGRRATVVDFEPSTSMRSRSLRALFYEDRNEAKLVNLWAGTDYKIVGQNPYYEDLKKHEYTYAEIPYVSETEKYEELLHGEAFFDEDMDDSDSENEVDEVVEVSVPPGPLGVLLDSGVQECAVVHGFTNLPTGGKGPIELDGRVIPGMYIIGIDETNASLMSLQQVTQLLGKLARKAKVIRFATLGHHDKPRADDDDTDGSSSERSHSSAPTPPKPSVPSPATTPSASAKPPAAPSAGGGMFTSRLSSIAAAMMDKKNKPSPSMPGASSTVSSLPGTPKETECVHCGVPSTAHKSADCPYR